MIHNEVGASPRSPVSESRCSGAAQRHAYGGYQTRTRLASSPAPHQKYTKSEMAIGIAEAIMVSTWVLLKYNRAHVYPRRPRDDRRRGGVLYTCLGKSVRRAY